MQKTSCGKGRQAAGNGAYDNAIGDTRAVAAIRAHKSS
jgi:hypothetical protein